MHLSRFTSLLVGALVAAILLAGIGAVIGIPVIYALGAGFGTSFVAIVVARMLESASAAPAATHDVAAAATTSPTTTRPATSPAGSERERVAAVRGPNATSTPPPDAAITNGARVFGNVKWFNRAKGYGFIHCDDDREVFVHHRNLRGEERQALQDGERVSFHIVERNRGPQAEDVAVERQ